MQTPEVDQQVAQYIVDSQAHDMFVVSRTFKAKGEKSDFMTVVASTDTLKAAYLFKPKSAVLDHSGLPESFMAALKPFNILGFIKDGDAKPTVDLLAGSSRPFASLKSAAELKKCLHFGSVLTFTNQLLRVRGLPKDVFDYDFKAFQAALRDQTELLKAMEEQTPGFSPFNV